MSNDRLARLQQRFEQQQQEQENRRNNTTGFYPFFLMKDGKEAIVRFLPDANIENPDLFLIQNNSHKLILNGKEVKVPCLHNYGKSCPICEASQAYYKQEGKDSKKGKYFWRKVQYLARVVVVEDPIEHKEGEESSKNKICVITLNGDFYKKIMAACTSKSDPLPDSPDDLKNGTNFIISKQKNGEYSSYDNSRFARNSSPVCIQIDEEKDIVDLKTLLKEEPSYDDLAEKLECHLTGRPYNDGSSGFNRVSNNITNLVNNDSSNNSVSSVTSTVDDGSSGGSTRYEEIQAKLKARREQRNNQE
ncbi:MAG: hypothetical protein KDH96_03385 [Candidatus Riesia sp.]|nr:hypothetical protein [Candidatus Riesia sp.]